MLSTLREMSQFHGKTLPWWRQIRLWYLWCTDKSQRVRFYSKKEMRRLNAIIKEKYEKLPRAHELDNFPSPMVLESWGLSASFQQRFESINIYEVSEEIKLIAAEAALRDCQNDLISFGVKATYDLLSGEERDWQYICYFCGTNERHASGFCSQLTRVEHFDRLIASTAADYEISLKAYHELDVKLELQVLKEKQKKAMKVLEKRQRKAKGHHRDALVDEIKLLAQKQMEEYDALQMKLETKMTQEMQRMSACFAKTIQQDRERYVKMDEQTGGRKDVKYRHDLKLDPILSHAALSTIKQWLSVLEQ
ncbi:hypothetical protein L5515_019322 [Caenorhabditis briggsae]|uniref:Uncharacterized protein n=1 Tax=Caenorhabditis briggsae TaxID=6238 RepID=A0AAE9JVB4_CAEBR|nr:hypothetical protein L5515_019322 [Caenorhabditis briggsae]